MRRTPRKIQILTFYAYRVLRPLPAVFAVIFAMLFARKLYRYFEFGDFM
jgi:peptidoglycan/LPS O-acetylase OafA/YrhL